MVEKTIEELYEENKRMVDEIGALGVELESLIVTGTVGMMFGCDAANIKAVSERIEQIQVLIDEKCEQAEKNSKITTCLLAGRESMVN